MPSISVYAAMCNLNSAKRDNSANDIRDSAHRYPFDARQNPSAAATTYNFIVACIIIELSKPTYYFAFLLDYAVLYRVIHISLCKDKLLFIP